VLDNFQLPLKRKIIATCLRFSIERFEPLRFLGLLPFILIALFLSSCNGKKGSASETRILSFPRASYSGEQSAILPYPLRNFLGEPVDLSPILRERDGYSPLQPLVLPFSRCSELPGPEETFASVADTAPILLYDLKAKKRIPWMGEPGEDPDLCLIFPLEGFSDGGEVCVLIQEDFFDLPPGTLDRSPCSGVSSEDSEVGSRPGWRFVVGTRMNRVMKSFRLISSVLRWLKTAPRPLILSWEENPPEARFTPGLGASLVIKGEFRVPRYLREDGTLAWDEERGEPILLGEDREQYFVVVPPTALTAEELRLIQFGHGLLGDPREVLSPDTGVLRERIPGIWGAVPWGMATRYLGRVGDVILNPGEFPLFRDRVIVGFVHQVLFSALLREEIGPEIGRRYGKPVSSEVRFIGISQGAILGGVLTALNPSLRRVVLHVGGGGWSVMMTHADAWLRPGGIREILRGTLPDPRARTLLIALWQNLWDEWDPAIYSEYWFQPPPGVDLSTLDRQIFFPYAISDLEVPNLASDLMLRTAGIPLLLPAFYLPYGVETRSYPFSGPKSASQWDVGIAELEHRAVRKLPAFADAVRHFFDTGELIDPCGGSPCRFSPPEG
jgi:hypothetical protein